MKEKRNIRRIIMRRFILYVLGIWLALALAELVLSLVTYETRYDFAEYVFSVTDGISAPVILLNGIWMVVVAAIFVFAIRRFGKGINKLFDLSMEERLKEDERKRAEVENERMRLFSHIAHDLKTPMTTVIGYAGALAEGLVDESSLQEYFLAIKNKSIQVNNLTDRLLSYSKLGTPGYKLNLAETDIAELARVVCASLFGEIEKKGMALEIDLPPDPIVCPADPLEISRVLNNLLVNAIRHNPPGSMLSVGMTADSGFVLIEIADSGTAIKPEIINDIFEPFISGDEARNSGGGTGLGLAIVKKVMERHSGEVYVREAAPPYTKAFVVKLPR